MTDFNTIRQELNTSRANKEISKNELFLSKERLRKATTELKNLARSFDSKNASHVSKQRELRSIIKEEKAKVSSLHGSYRTNIVDELEWYERFAQFTDPKKLISNFSDRIPILLFPVRVETRFKKVEVRNEIVDELWVRVYPDDCVINTFESVPSDMELDNTEFYWSNLWQAGGLIDEERAAWRSLVSSHGSGRAKWLIEKHLPENVAEKPTKAEPEDVILVIPVYNYPLVAEQDAIRTYWTSIWKSNGNVELHSEAFAQLEAVVGLSRAEEINETLIPDNIDDLPGGSKTVEEVNVSTVFIKFAERSSIDSKEDSWSQAPRVENMPERFVVRGYVGDKQDFEVMGNLVPSPLYTGPDPSLMDDEILQKRDGELQFDEGMKWMVDFNEAIRVGMGLKVRLTPAQAKRGFDKIVVMGVRLSLNESESADYLENLIKDHSNSRKGFEVLAQGTATNNTDAEGSGYLSSDDPDKSFDELQNEFNFEHKNEHHEKSDGQLLAEFLGLNESVFQNVTGSGRFDQRDAWAMNTALWPATLGYMMESLMHPVFSESDIEYTREFFTNYVSGRGIVPAIRIGRQPYGILPTTKFDSMKWFKRQHKDNNISHFTHFPIFQSSFAEKLYNVLTRIDGDWAAHFSKVSYVGKSGDAHQLLLDVVGLNPGSVEFHRRYAEGVESLYNRLLFYSFFSDKTNSLIPDGYYKSGMDLLNSFGFKGEEIPDILEKVFIKNQDLMSPFLIDDRPVSETEPIRNYMKDEAPEGNYIKWLIDAVGVSHNELRQRKGFKNNRPPSALLYLMLHHALDLSYVDVSLRLHLQAERLNVEQYRQAKIDPVFMHVQTQNNSSESKWQYLYKTDQAITNSPTIQIGEYIPQLIGSIETPAAYMTRMVEALGYLQEASTAQLERAFTEHIDCCTYRLDAWKNGFMKAQLQGMKYYTGEDKTTIHARSGVYLGAFGYLEDVRNENKLMTPADLSEDLKSYFENEDLPPLVKDDKNDGYILGPSINHSITAAVLRNGYTTNASSSNPDVLKVNLSSERVRKALSIIEGIRGGQSLGALLGYQLERGLHDHHPGIELDYYIYQLRKAFPLRGNRMKSTFDEDASAEEIDARNVVDGLALINHIKESGNKNYPFGKTLEPVEFSNQQTAIDEEVDKIMDINDAVADVAISESVHQVVQGNYDRGAATMDTYSKGSFPPIPDVIQTPRSGINITQRVGIQFEPAGSNFTTSPIAAIPMTPRALSEPAVNKWLAGVLPVPNSVVCEVEYYDFVQSKFVPVIITQAKLLLQPIDMIYFVDTQNTKAMSTLDDRITQYLLTHNTIRPDAEIRINYTKAVSGMISFFELNPLLNSLRAIILRSKPLEANDVARPIEVSLRQKSTSTIDSLRIQESIDMATSRLSNLNTELTSLGGTLADPDANRETLISNIDAYITNFANAVIPLSDFMPEQTGIGFAYGWKDDTYKSLLKKIQSLIDRWDARLIKYDEYLVEFASTTVREEQENAILGAERQVSTSPTYPLPLDLSNFITTVLNPQRDSFVVRLSQISNSLALNTNLLFDLISDIRPKLNYSQFDNEVTDLTDIEDSIILFIQDLHANFTKTHSSITGKTVKAQDILDVLSGISDPAKKVVDTQEAAKQIFGEDFVVIPEFTVVGDAADEWQNAYNDETQLLAFSAPSGTNFPVDNWMHGVSRVREKVKNWESLVFLTEAFNTNQQQLHPLQLPYIPGDSWLAVNYPEDYEIDSDRILYTAHYAVPFDKNSKQCGLLIDEWTEVIPSKDETAGVAFHYDKPNSEPAQVLLLAMPTEFSGGWQWEDLMNIVLDTFDEAKKRAVEPDIIDDSGYAWFLPAVISSVTSHAIAPSLNLALAETNLFDFINLPDND